MTCKSSRMSSLAIRESSSFRAEQALLTRLCAVFVQIPSSFFFDSHRNGSDSESSSWRISRRCRKRGKSAF